MQDTYLGIELGSTRIKAVLTNEKGTVIASGAHDWENSFENNYWTYSLEKVWAGIQDAFSNLRENAMKSTGEKLESVSAMGISAMMHGYLPFNKNGELLTPFRTWRNTNTSVAAEKLTDTMQFNIPERWSIAHIYQAMLDNEPHVKHISYLTTLAGYVHWQLTDKKVLGVGDASGMFPIDSNICDYDKAKTTQFDELLNKGGYGFKLNDIMPKVLKAGEKAGTLTEKGAKLLDQSGEFNAGIPMCPPEGDAGTGMVATNSVAQLTGNVSAGTSVFAMIVLEKQLKKLHREIDMVTTPCASPVAMVHCNTCTSDLDAWVKMFDEVLKAANCNLSKARLYDMFYNKALEGDADCGGLLCYNYYAGEPVVGVENGRPMFVRKPENELTFANFARTQIYATMAALKIGMDILFNEEKVKLETLLGHGGLFKTPTAGQKMLAGALNVPVAVMETAGEGGPWGIALLAAYMQNKKDGQSLQDYLKNNIFAGAKGSVVQPDTKDVKGFAKYIDSYKIGLMAEKAAEAI